MKKLRNVMRKCMASLLVLCMAAAPCVTEIGSVFAEPDTDTDIEPVAYKVTLNDAQNGKVSFKDSEERTHSYKEGDKVAGAQFTIKYYDGFYDRNSLPARASATWKDVVYAVLRQLGTSVSLDKIYEEIEPHKKAQGNPHWKAKVRQTLQMLAKIGSATHVAYGKWCVA